MGRLELFSDVLKGQAHSQPPPQSEHSDIRHDYPNNNQSLEMYNELVERDKDLFNLKCDIHEIKCSLMKYFGEQNMPPPPVYTPITDMKRTHNHRPVNFNTRPSFTQRVQNQIYRQIMDNKSSEATDELEPIYEEHYVERNHFPRNVLLRNHLSSDPLLRSWENINHLDE